MSRSLVPSSAVRALGLVAGVAALALALGSVATASVPSSTTGAITACYSTATGAMRVVDVQRRQRCRPGERAVAWGPSWLAKGAYDARRSYPAGSVVTVAGSSYVARALVPAGRAPGASSSWNLVAAAGAPGAPGAPGAAGRNGADMLVGPLRRYGEAVVTAAGAVESGGTNDGGIVTAEQIGPGLYYVRFPGFYNPSASSLRATVHVTPLTQLDVACTSPILFGEETGRTLKVGVRCFTTTNGFATDTPFSITVTA